MQIFFVLFFIEITTIENAIENDQLISVCLYYFVVIYFQISIFELLKTTYRRRQIQEAGCDLLSN